MGFFVCVVMLLMGLIGLGKMIFLCILNWMNDKVFGYCYSGDVLLGGCSIFNYCDVLEFCCWVGMLF